MHILETGNESERELGTSIRAKQDGGTKPTTTDHDEGEEAQERQVINALSLLRAPEKSDLARKPNMSSNDPCKNKNTIATATNVSPAARIREFPDKCFNNSAQDKKGAIFCEACREEVSVKTSTIMCHKKSEIFFRKREI